MVVRHYFHFNSTASDRYADSVPGINAVNTYNLGFSGSYTGSTPLGRVEQVTWSSIIQAFENIRSLTRFQDYQNNNRDNIRHLLNENAIGNSLTNIILVASESLRTISIRNHIGNLISNENSINWQRHIAQQAKNWNTNSRSNDISDIAILSPNAIGTIEPNISDQPSTSRGTSSRRPAWYSKTKEKKEEVCSVKKKDKNGNRGTRSTDDCLIINSIAILQQDSNLSSTVKKGALWIGTNKGVYFRYQNGEYYDIPPKINNLYESVRSIDVDHQGSAYAVTDNDNLYYVPDNSWDAVKIDFQTVAVKSIAILQQDSNLNFSVKKGSVWVATNNGVYFQNPREKGENSNWLMRIISELREPIKSIDVDHQGSAYAISENNNLYYFAANSLDTLNPVKIDFQTVAVKSIAILQQDSNLNFSVKKGSVWVATNNGVYFQNPREKGENSNWLMRIISELREPIKSIDVDHQGSAYAISENNNLYYFAANSLDTLNPVKIKHDELKRKKRENVVINKNKWTDDLIKSVNQEQHLPTINNQSSYVNNNVTTSV